MGKEGYVFLDGFFGVMFAIGILAIIILTYQSLYGSESVEQDSFEEQREFDPGHWECIRWESKRPDGCESDSEFCIYERTNCLQEVWSRDVVGGKKELKVETEKFSNEVF